MTILNGSLTQADDTVFTGPDGLEYRYFNPLTVLADEAGTDSEVYNFWCKLCGSQWGPQLWDYTNLAGQQYPQDYPCMTPCDMANADTAVSPTELCNAAALWLFADFKFQANGIPPGDCTPGIPCQQ